MAFHVRAFQLLATITLLCGLAPNACLRADEHQRLDRLSDSWSFNLYVENDVFAGTDRNYTNGTKLSWVSPDATRFRDIDEAEWLRAIVERLPYIHEDGLQRNVVLSIGQNMYTPADITDPNYNPDDRPYAGWLYAGFGFHSKSERKLDSWEINLGIVGPYAFAEETQKLVHKLIDSPEPQGWKHQIRTEPAINFVYLHKNRMTQVGSLHGWKTELFSHYGGSFGNVETYLNAGFEVRTGWNLPTDFGSALIRMAADPSAPTSFEDPRFSDGLHSLGFSLSAAVDGRGVARDIFLDGNTFRDSPSQKKIPWVGDLTLGASLTASSWKLSYTQVFRTRQFENQDRAHVFGSLSLSYAY